MSVLKRNAIGVSHIIFFVVSAAAPLTGMLGGVPTAISLGNGAGIPGAYVIAGCILLIFSVGYTAMSRHVTNAGAFYAYITLGLGRHVGVGAGFVAIISYTTMQLALYGLFGFFCTIILDPIIGFSPPWYLYSLFILFIIHLLGFRNIDFNIKILGVSMILEMSILLILSIAIVLHSHELNIRPFLPQQVFNGNLGIGIMFALASFIGFEATAIYSEECRDPKRSVSRATYASVSIIMIFFAFVTWAIVTAYGINNVMQAASKDPGNFWFSQSTKYIGMNATTMMRILLLNSIFASLLAFHHTITRYLFAMSREGIIPKKFAQTHTVFQSPHKASHFQTLSAVIFILLSAVLHAHPYDMVFTWMGTLGTLGIAGLQLLVSIAVIVFFYRTQTDTRLWHTRIAPLLGALVLAYALLLIVENLSVLSGTENAFVRSFPILQLGMLFFGITISLIQHRTLKKQRIIDEYAASSRST